MKQDVAFVGYKNKTKHLRLKDAVLGPKAAGLAC